MTMAGWSSSSSPRARSPARGGWGTATRGGAAPPPPPPSSSVVALRARLAAREVIAISQSDAQVVYWEALATLPAQRLAGYGYTAATTQDSMPHSNPYTAFFVSALTPDIDVFYSSAIDSGYSVDNVPPR